MDAQADSKRLEELMDQLWLTWYGYPAKDATKQAYFTALRDVRFSEVKANADRLLRTATRATPFPKPAELRNAPVSEPTPSSDMAFRAMEERSARLWKERLARDPVEAQIEWRIARAARMSALLAANDPESAADWDRKYYRWSRLRYAPVAEKTKALQGSHADE